MTTLTLSSNDATRLKVDALVIGVAQGPDGPLPVLPEAAEGFHEAFGGRLTETLAALGATGKEGEVTRFATLGAITAPVVVAAGIGKLADARSSSDLPEAVRRGFGAAIRSLAGVDKVGVLLHGGAPDFVRAASEGALLGAYSFTRYRSASAGDHKAPVSDVTLVVPDAKDKAAKNAVRRAQVVGRVVSLCRDLVNTAPADLSPKAFAEIARTEATNAGLEVEVLDEKALKKGGYGGIVGVGQGSANPPRLVRIAYAPRRPKASIAFVGKGITFDSGGLSLKPAQSMEWMKSDMSGAAAVLATMLAVAALKPAVAVTGWIPMAENMPSGAAIRPSDILTMYSGTRVEVNNTDAEGRLILADAIARACEESPNYVVDVATLTGAQLVALGTRVAGVMGNDDDLRTRVVAAAARAGEPMWPMPLPAELRKGLDSEIADLVNTGPREGGMLTAGLFLQEFVGDGVTWAHVDIAGPSYNTGDAYGYTPKGGTGAAVRAFVELVEELATTG